MVPITQLPDLCTLAIFKRIPLTNLISKLSCVCTKWNTLLPVDLGQRKRLVLVCSPDDHSPHELDLIIDSVQKIENRFEFELIKYLTDDEDKPLAPLMSRKIIEFNLIRVPKVNHVKTLTEQFTTSLIDNLRGITRLTVVITLDYFLVDQTNTTLRQLARIIDHYRASLVSLKVDFDEIMRTRGDTEVEIDAQVLFDSINRIGNQLLDVSLNIDFPCKRLSTDSFAFLARVQSFTTHKFNVSHGLDPLLLPSLVQHAAGGTCTQIYTGSFFGFEELINLNPHLIAKFRRLAIVGEESDGDGEEGADEEQVPKIDRIMQLFGNQFTSLSSLELNVIPIPLTKIVRFLSRMTGLIYLKIQYLFAVDDNYESEEGLLITQLPSVRMFTFNDVGSSHTDIDKMHLGELFPNLQVVDYEPANEFIECVECATVLKGGETDLQELERMKKTGKCARLVLKSFLRLIPNLRQVWYSTVVLEKYDQFFPSGYYNLRKLSQLVLEE